MVKNYYATLTLVTLFNIAMQITNTHASFNVQQERLYKHLPHLHQTLIKQQSNETQLIEILEHIANQYQTTTTWRLPQDKHHFVADLLHILDSIAAKNSTTPSYYTCIIDGNSGTLPMLLLVAGLFHMGIQDVALRVIGNEIKPTLKNLNRIIRKTVLSKTGRFHLHQENSIETLMKKKIIQLRIPNLVLIASNSEKNILLKQICHENPLVFNLINHTRSE